MAPPATFCVILPRGVAVNLGLDTAVPFLVIKSIQKVNSWHNDIIF